MHGYYSDGKVKEGSGTNNIFWLLYSSRESLDRGIKWNHIISECFPVGLVNTQTNKIISFSDGSKHDLGRARMVLSGYDGDGIPTKVDFGPYAVNLNINDYHILGFNNLDTLLSFLQLQHYDELHLSPLEHYLS